MHYIHVGRQKHSQEESKKGSKRYVFRKSKRERAIIVVPVSLFSAVPEDKYFLVATRTTISRVSLDGLRYQVLLNNLGNAIAIDYDHM